MIFTGPIHVKEASRKGGPARQAEMPRAWDIQDILDITKPLTASCL